MGVERCPEAQKPPEQRKGSIFGVLNAHLLRKHGGKNGGTERHRHHNSMKSPASNSGPGAEKYLEIPTVDVTMN